MKQLFRDRRFALLALGQAVNGIGSWAALVAIWGFASYRFHAGPGELVLLGLGWGLPPFLFGPLAGVVIDRLDPRRVTMVANTASAAVSVTMIFAGSFERLLLLAVLHGVGKAFSVPALDALPARLVSRDRLFSANAVLSMAIDLSIVGGPLVAAGVIAVAGLGAAFAVDAATYVIGALAVAFVRLRPIERDGDVMRTGPWREALEGLRITWGAAAARPLMVLAAAIWLSFGMYAVLEPLYVRDVLGSPVSTFAFLQTAFGIGLVGTGLVLPRIRRFLGTAVALAAVVTASGMAAALYVGTHVVAVAFVGVFAWGVTVALFNAPARTLLMAATPEHAHGRVMSTWRTVNAAAHLAPSMLTGGLAAVIGVQATMLVGASAAGLVGLATLVVCLRRRAAGAAPVSEPASPPSELVLEPVA
jgi:MFS family permease